MNLYELINEIAAISSNDLQLSDNRYKKILEYREAYYKSLFNTINKLIEGSFDKRELKKIIYLFSERLERALIVSLYRRYLWLDPTDTITYHNFIALLDRNDQKILLDYVNKNNFDSALMVVEEIFNKIFLSSPALIPPIKMRSLADIAWELCQLDMGTIADIATMRKTSAYNMRYDYLSEQIKLRIADPNISMLELREFFTSNTSLGIVLDCGIGLTIAKRYFNASPTDHEMYGYFFTFLHFWHLTEEEQTLLQYVAVNDFDNALKFINALKI